MFTRDSRSVNAARVRPPLSLTTVGAPDTATLCSAPSLKKPLRSAALLRRPDRTSSAMRSAAARKSSRVGASTAPTGAGGVDSSVTLGCGFACAPFDETGTGAVGVSREAAVVELFTGAGATSRTCTGSLARRAVSTRDAERFAIARNAESRFVAGGDDAGTRFGGAAAVSSAGVVGLELPIGGVTGSGVPIDFEPLSVLTTTSGAAASRVLALSFPRTIRKSPNSATATASPTPAITLVCFDDAAGARSGDRVKLAGA